MRHRYSFAWPRGLVIAVSLGTVGVLAACTDATGPAKDAGDLGASGIRIDQSLQPSYAQTASDQLANDIPGFGGAFVSAGVLHVYLTQAANTEQGQAGARAAISSLLASGNRPQMPIEFLPGKHSLKQLRAWENSLKGFYRRFGVQTAQVDERYNRFDIAVGDDDGAQGLQAAASRIGIPAEIITIRTGVPRVVPFVDLSNKVRPAGGGLRILTMFSTNGVPYRFYCTYGFNAQIDDGSGNRYMVTNAHCVEPENVFGGLIGATVAQPDSNVTSLLGYVTSNPASSPNNVGCAPGDSCRESDAALVQADNFRFPASSWDIGGIHQTTVRGVGPYSGGSTTINGRITIANASTVFFAGDTLEKIGETTGWTAGAVTGTCVYHSVGGGGRMCNGVIAAGANHGDSGSPVFWKDSQGSVHLMGILWGGPEPAPGTNSSEFWFSRWQSIVDDLSPFHTLLVTPSGGGSCNPPPGQQCPK